VNYDIIKRMIDSEVQNLDPEISIADGTIVNLIISGCAVAIAGLYGYSENIGRKPFPDLCLAPDLIRWAIIKGVEFNELTSEDELRRKVLLAFRVPASGGDLQSWRDAIEKALNALGEFETRYSIFENARARGIGSVDIVLGHNSSAVSAVRSEVESMRPLGAADTKVTTSIRRDVEIRIDTLGFVDSTAVSNEVIERFGGLGDMPGSDLFRSVIEAIAVRYGASNAIMFWRNTGDTEWNEGTCEALKMFDGLDSVYQHLIVTDCFVRVGQN